MNLINLALEEAIDTYTEFLNFEVKASLIKITKKQMKKLNNKKDIFLFVDKNMNNNIYIQTDTLYEQIEHFKKYSDKFNFLKRALLHELTHLYEEDVIKRNPSLWEHINNIVENSPNKRNINKINKLKSELLAEFTAENIKKYNSLHKS